MDNLRWLFYYFFWKRCARSVYSGRTCVAEMIPLVFMHAKKGEEGDRILNVWLGLISEGATESGRFCGRRERDGAIWGVRRAVKAAVSGYINGCLLPCEQRNGG